MDLISILATVILFTTVSTLVVAVAAYMAYKVRERRKPKRRNAPEEKELSELIFLEPYVPRQVADKHTAGEPPAS